MPPGFVLIESGGKRTLSGVTLETMPQAIRKLGLLPDQEFSIIAESAESDDGNGKKNRLEKLRALKGFGAKRYGPRTVEDIDAQVREFRGDE